MGQVPGRLFGTPTSPELFVHERRITRSIVVERKLKAFSTIYKRQRLRLPVRKFDCLSNWCRG
jgi:hypothetical protein